MGKAVCLELLTTADAFDNMEKRGLNISRVEESYSDFVKLGKCYLNYYKGKMTGLYGNFRSERGVRHTREWMKKKLRIICGKEVFDPHNVMSLERLVVRGPLTNDAPALLIFRDDMKIHPGVCNFSTENELASILATETIQRDAELCLKNLSIIPKDQQSEWIEMNERRLEEEHHIFGRAFLYSFETQFDFFNIDWKRGS